MTGSDDGLFGLIRFYFARFGEKPCCFEDLRTFICPISAEGKDEDGKGGVNEEERKQIAAFLDGLAREIVRLFFFPTLAILKYLLLKLLHFMGPFAYDRTLNLPSNAQSTLISSGDTSTPLPSFPQLQNRLVLWNICIRIAPRSL